MGFHRLTTPAYFGGLPGGYDYLNTPSDPSVGGSGVPALVGAKKSGGPNDGTYFVAFGEDGQSAFANRPAAALGNNTDLLDDVLRTSVPSITHADATAAGATSSIVLTGQIYTGDFGTTNNQTNRNKIVRITDQNDNDLEVSGSKIVATLIHDGASANVVGVSTSAFRTNATVTVAPPIPDTTTYRVYYGVRNNYTNIAQADRSALFEESLRTVNNVSGEVRALLRQIHSEASINQAWDAAFDSTIRSLASAGLNERYRRATLQPAGFVTGNYNVAGGGAVIRRDGQAVSILGASDFLLQGVAWKDPNHALLKLCVEDARSSSASAIGANSGGDYGVWHESEWKGKNTAGTANMFTRTVAAGPALIDVSPYDMRGSTLNGDTLLTFIDASSASATLNPDSGGSTTARSTVQCGAGQYFSLTGPIRTAIRLGLDLLEVTDSSNKVRTFTIISMPTSTRVVVVGPAGQTAGPFSASAEAGCKVRIIQVVSSVGGYLGRDGEGGLIKRPLLVIPPAVLTTVVANEDVVPCSFFGAQTGSVADATAQARRARALEFGSTASPDAGGVVNGTVTPTGWLNGDGSARITALDINGNASIDKFGNTVLDDVECESIACLDVTGTNATFNTYREEIPEQLFVINEDFVRFTQTFSPELLFTFENTWQFTEISGVVTVNNGTPSQKHPGKLQLIGSGGGTGKRLAIYPTSQFPFAFAGLEHLTVVAAVNDDPANNAATLNVMLVDAVTGGGNNILGLAYFNGIGWCVKHVVAGVPGSHDFAVLGAQVNDEFVVVRFLKNGPDIDVLFNGSVILTVAAAEFPSGLGTLLIYVEQSAGDAQPTTWTVDKVNMRVKTATNRAGV